MSNTSLRFAGVVCSIAAGCAGIAPLTAGPDAGLSVAERVQTAGQSSASPVLQPVELAEFDYKGFFRRAMQLGMLSQTLGYTVQVATDGSVTECALARRFQSPYTVQELCKAISRYSRFEPARDAEGNAIVASYTGEVVISSYFRPSR